MFQSRPGLARLALLSVVGAGCLALAACGSSSSTADTGAGTASSAVMVSSSASSTRDPLASLTADQVAARVVADAKAASSVTMIGTLRSTSGETVNVNLAIKPGHGCTGTMEFSGKGSFKLLMIGTAVYMNPDNEFWKSFGGPHASAVIALVNGRWLKTTTSDKNVVVFTGFCDVSQMFGTNGKQDVLTKGAVTTLNGTRVLTINDAKQEVAYVTDTSKPELVEFAALKGSSKDSGKITVTYDLPVALTAPPASQVLDGSQFGF